MLPFAGPAAVLEVATGWGGRLTENLVNFEGARTRAFCRGSSLIGLETLGKGSASRNRAVERSRLGAGPASSAEESCRDAGWAGMVVDVAGVGRPARMLAGLISGA
jgi:hypothetical protein